MSPELLRLALLEPSAKQILETADELRISQSAASSRAPTNLRVIVTAADPFYLIHTGESWKNEKACFDLVGRFVDSLP